MLSLRYCVLRKSLGREIEVYEALGEVRGFLVVDRFVFLLICVSEEI